MRLLRLALFLVLPTFWGCATSGYDDRMDKVRTMNRQNINRLTMGMTKAQVLSVMGTKTYEAKFITINNPYRTETTRTTGGEPVIILFYYTDLKAGDYAITDDELTPLVF